jgi:hypothetical protein
MSGKKKLKFKPSKWDETKPWFYSFYGHEESWATRMTKRKDRREAKAALKKGDYENAGNKPRRTGGWISW